MEIKKKPILTAEGNAQVDSVGKLGKSWKGNEVLLNLVLTLQPYSLC